MHACSLHGAPACISSMLVGCSHARMCLLMVRDGLSPYHPPHVLPHSSLLGLACISSIVQLLPPRHMRGGDSTRRWWKQRPIRGRQGTFLSPMPDVDLNREGESHEPCVALCRRCGGAGWHSNMDLLACYPPGCSLFVGCASGDLSGHPSIHSCCRVLLFFLDKGPCKREAPCMHHAPCQVHHGND